MKNPKSPLSSLDVVVVVDCLRLRNNLGCEGIKFVLDIRRNHYHVWLNKLAQLVKSSIVWPILNTETEYFTVSKLSDIVLVFEAVGVYQTVFFRKIKHSNQRFF